MGREPIYNRVSSAHLRDPVDRSFQVILPLADATFRNYHNFSHFDKEKSLKAAHLGCSRIGIELTQNQKAKKLQP